MVAAVEPRDGQATAARSGRLVEALALVFFAYCLLISFAVPYAQELAIGHTESVQQT